MYYKKFSFTSPGITYKMLHHLNLKIDISIMQNKSSKQISFFLCLNRKYLLYFDKQK
jgi:hypothetical protein